MREANFGSKIRQLRRQARMTQVEFASRIGVTNITVSKWENERQTPSLNRMAELERVLGVNPGDQVPGEGLLPSAGTWLNRTRVTAVVTGVVMSLKTGVSMPGICDAEVDSAPGPRHSAIDGPGPATDLQLPQDARDVTGDTGDEATVATEEALGVSIELGRHGPGAPCEHPALNGVGELIDFDPHEPGQHTARSGGYGRCARRYGRLSGGRPLGGRSQRRGGARNPGLHSGGRPGRGFQGESRAGHARRWPLRWAYRSGSRGRGRNSRRPQAKG